MEKGFDVSCISSNFKFKKKNLNLRSMSKQATLTCFLQKSNKKAASTIASKCSPKKLKKEIENFEELQPKVNDTKNIDKENTNSVTLTKDGPHKLRLELIDWNQKYPIISKNVGLSWYKALKNEFEKPYFADLNKFVDEQRNKNSVYPPPEKVWSWTQACRLEDVKVVMLGQDPYHNPGQAHGLCFSVQIGVPPPPSLVNMYKELETDIEGFSRPKHGYLIGWARQGVLLLNACLTVTKNSPNSHKDKGWENLTTSVIKYLNDNSSGIVFLLWGSFAQKKADFVDKTKHHVLKSAHPSPLSASRGFFGCKHFSKCNELLVKDGKQPIDWKCLPTE